MSAGQVRVDLLITALQVAAGHLAECKTRELELASVRTQVKSEAIGRMMCVENPQKPGSTYSATAAAEVVSFDKAYQIQQADERAATAATIRAMGEYECAKLRALFAVNSTPVIEEEPVSARMNEKHVVEVG